MNTQVAEQGNSLTAGKKKQVSFMGVRNFGVYMRWFISRLNVEKVASTTERLEKCADARRKMVELHARIVELEANVFQIDEPQSTHCTCVFCAILKPNHE